MSSPPDQPPTEPDQRPVDATIQSKREKRKGAIVATAAVLVSSALAGLSEWGLFGLMVAPVVALLCVILGSILAIFKPTRQFAVGFLNASAIIIFVTAGACTFAFMVYPGMG